IANISSETQRMHIIPPSTKHFYIKYNKKERFVPGLFIEVTIEFTPDEWRYYYDCIRIHSRGEENLLVPIHAYPVMSSEAFPKEVHFAPVPLGESKTKMIPLRCEAPVDFEFQLTVLQPNPAFRVSPLTGVIPGGEMVKIQVTFTPIDYSTAIMKLQLLISQFNAEPLVCTFTGTSEPGLAKRLKEKSQPDIFPDKPRNGILDPVMIDPLGRTRMKKLKTKPSGDGKAQEIVRDGYRFPTTGLSNPAAIAAVLSQQQGKLKAKDVRQAVQSRKDFTGSTKQMKETMFEYQVYQNIQEERQNQLRWCVRLGENTLAEPSKRQILAQRTKAEKEYKLNRGDPVPRREFNRSSTGCQLRRVHRQACDVPDHQPKFDVLVNDEWSKRHMVLNKFIQAGRKVIIRSRANKNLHSLSGFLSGWRKGKFTRDQTSNVEERVLDTIPGNIQPTSIHPFSFPLYKSPDIKDDLEVDALGTLSVQPTAVKVKTHIPYLTLKVPQQYHLLGYKPHSVARASTGYVPPKLNRPLRVGAQVRGSVLSSPVPSWPYMDDEEGVVEEVASSPPPPRPATIGTFPLDTAQTEPEVTPLVVPAAMFRPINFHIPYVWFYHVGQNPSPGLQVFQQPLPYGETDEDYHLCPLPRHRQPSRGSGKPGRHYLERQDVIPGVMTWKRFPSQSLVSLANNPTLSSVWLPRWTDPFSEDLLPTDVPPLLDFLPEEDELSDDELDEGESELKEVPVPTPEMVNAQFASAESVLSDLRSQQPS
ncbi:predicted protein, partial [Nematostella vectensis]